MERRRGESGRLVGRLVLKDAFDKEEADALQIERVGEREPLRSEGGERCTITYVHMDDQLRRGAAARLELLARSREMRGREMGGREQCAT